MIITLDHIEEIAENIKMFWFKPERTLNYTAGQFIEMTLPHNDADSRGQKRWFTLSSSPTEELVSITTKQAVGQISTFKKNLFALQPGSQVTISEPMGDFVLPKDTTLPLLYVVGGIGVTPVRSMVKLLIDTEQKRSLHIIYNARILQDIVFNDLFQHYGTNLDVIISEPPTGWTGMAGQVSAATIVNIQNRNQALTYVSGPETMVEKLEADLLKAGLSADKLVLDFYPGYTAI